jgi:hypothetical protein
MPLCLHRHAPTAEGLASVAGAAQSKQKTNRTKPHIRKPQVRMCRHRSLRARRDPKPEMRSDGGGSTHLRGGAHQRHSWQLLEAAAAFLCLRSGPLVTRRLARRRHELFLRACRRGGSKHGCSRRVSVNCNAPAPSERHESGLHRLRSKRPAGGDAPSRPTDSERSSERREGGAAGPGRLLYSYVRLSVG